MPALSKSTSVGHIRELLAANPDVQQQQDLLVLIMLIDGLEETRVRMQAYWGFFSAP
jgi:hypothetical protein